LPQPGDNEVTFAIFEPSCHLLLPLKARGNSVKSLAQGNNKITCRFMFTLSLFNVERQAGKLRIPCLTSLVWLVQEIEHVSTDYEADAIDHAPVYFRKCL